MNPAERIDLAEPSAGGTPRSRNKEFVDFVRSRSADAGDRARLRRSLHADDTINDDAWWLLGAWLPADPNEALILARVAAWIAVTHPGRPEPYRTVAAELGDAANGITPDVARHVLEGVTREGSSTSARLGHITRCLPRCQGERIDWTQMISDLRGLVRGGDWAHGVRSRWYRAYYDAFSPTRSSDSLTERNQP